MNEHYYECPERELSPADPHRVLCEACGEETTVDDLESRPGGCEYCADAQAPCGDPVSEHRWDQDCDACYNETNPS